MKYKDFIESSLQEVSVVARESFGKVTGTVKGNDSNQVLTETDLKVGQALIKKIQEEFPEYNIIDEEAGVTDKKSDYTWVIDPIDGTSNFANGVPLYGIMLGLLKGSEPFAGGVALPSFSEVYTAEKGEGAYCNEERISMGDGLSLKDSLVAYGIDGHRENPEMTREESKLLTEIVLSVRNLRMSNSVFDLAMVVQGKYGAFLNRTSKIWDNVAQHILTEEAGGVYTDFFGGKMDYSNPLTKANDNFTFLAAPPMVHKKLLSIIQP